MEILSQFWGTLGPRSCLTPSEASPELPLGPALGERCWNRNAEPVRGTLTAVLHGFGPCLPFLGLSLLYQNYPGEVRRELWVIWASPHVNPRALGKRCHSSRCVWNVPWLPATPEPPRPHLDPEQAGPQESSLGDRAEQGDFWGPPVSHPRPVTHLQA